MSLFNFILLDSAHCSSLSRSFFIITLSCSHLPAPPRGWSATGQCHMSATPSSHSPRRKQPQETPVQVTWWIWQSGSFRRSPSASLESLLSLCYFSPFFSLGSKKIMRSKQLIMFTFFLLGYQEAQSLDQSPIFNGPKPFKNP